MASKPKLNLAAFAGAVSAATNTTHPDAEIEISKIDVLAQVRQNLGSLDELTAGIKAIGVQVPIIVMVQEGGRYRLIAGQRRLQSSLNAGKTRIPALIKRDLSEFEIRRIQVVENHDRENLSAFDEAMGVVQDIKNFGLDEAAAIWNRSKAWVAKRSSASAFHNEVKDLLQNGQCNDLEVLLVLDQLQKESKDDFDRMVARLKQGSSLSRDEARNKLQTVRQFQREREDLERQSNKRNQVDTDARGSNDSGASSETATWVPSTSAPRGKDSASPDAPVHRASKTTLPVSGTKSAGKEDDQQQTREAKQRTEQLATIEQRRAVELAAIKQLRLDACEVGADSGKRFHTLFTKMHEQGFDFNEGEFVLWSAFLTTVLPIIHSLSEKRIRAYFSRLQAELKNKDAAQLLAELLPEGGTVPEMPKDWAL